MHISKRLPTIYIPKLEKCFHPCSSLKKKSIFREFRYPSYALADKTSEDYFRDWILRSYPLKSISTDGAELTYISANWTKIALRDGLESARLMFEECIGRHCDGTNAVFTVIQHDDADIIAGKYLDNPNLIIAVGSRKVNSGNTIDIPLVTTPVNDIYPSAHDKRINKKYQACFIGRITHPCRAQLVSLLSDEMPLTKDVLIIETDKISPKQYFSYLSQSVYALCPRGYGGSSFRFFEALQLNCIPILVGDTDTRPIFETHPNAYSHYFSKVSHEIIDLLYTSSQKTSFIAEKGFKVYADEMKYDSWPRQLILKLTSLLG